MSDEAALELEDELEKKWDQKNRRNFIAYMEHKLHSKERRITRHYK